VFAFKLAREATGKTEAAYSGDDRRALLAIEPTFKCAFVEAKARIRNMDYRYIEERDQKRQALLELYCAIALQCPYNDFDTH
jgi:hypothetical protein